MESCLRAGPEGAPGIRDAELVRELANAHFEADDLPTAESLLRASLSLKESALTRQRLDAVLTMQNK